MQINNEVIVVSFDECMEIIKNNYNGQTVGSINISRDDERVLIEHFGNKLIAITHFPSVNRPFYMK